MEEIKNTLEKVINEAFGISTEVEVTVAPELEEKSEFRADFATNVAMKLVRELHKNPREIAEEIVARPEFAKYRTEIAGPGFINFMLPDEYFIQKIGDFSAKFEENISQDEYSGKN